MLKRPKTGPRIVTADRLAPFPPAPWSSAAAKAGATRASASSSSSAARVNQRERTFFVLAVDVLLANSLAACYDGSAIRLTLRTYARGAWSGPSSERRTRHPPSALSTLGRHHPLLIRAFLTEKARPRPARGLPHQVSFQKSEIAYFLAGKAGRFVVSPCLAFPIFSIQHKRLPPPSAR